MYHALSDGGPTDPGQDPHYTIPKEAFARHLDMAVAGGGARSARDWLDQRSDAPFVLTFDDGHISNYALAYPELKRHGCNADFFVNPEHVGRPEFASWVHLREMAEGGMSIQSHSYSHRYLTALTPHELREELTRSKSAIEQAVGQPVTLLAPPGGRMPRKLGEIAREIGYRWILSSRPGQIHAGARGPILPRMAVTAQLDETTLRSWLQGDATALTRARVRYAALAGLKGILGDQRYERLRGRLLGRGAGV